MDSWSALWSMNPPNDDADAEFLERPRPRLSDEQIAHAEQRVARGLPAFTWKQYVRRQRHVRFVEAFMLEWLRRGDMDEAVTRAALYAFKGRMTNKGANKKGWQTLKRPDVCQAVEKVFEQNGFSFTDIVKQHIEHIRGGIIRSKVVETTDKDGNLTVQRTTEELLPNYAALRDLERLIIPNQPQKFEFANTTKRHVGGAIAGEGAPEIATDEFPKLSARIERDDEVQIETEQAQDAQTKD